MNELAPIPGDCGDEYRKPPFLTASGDLSHHLDSLPPPYPTKVGTDGRTRALSGTIWEDLVGFSRAVRKGDRIFVSGTTATHDDRVIGERDPAAQTHFAIDKVEGALQSLGGRLEDVVRTRVYVADLDDWRDDRRGFTENVPGHPTGQYPGRGASWSGRSILSRSRPRRLSAPECGGLVQGWF